MVTRDLVAGPEYCSRSVIAPIVFLIGTLFSGGQFPALGQPPDSNGKLAEQQQRLADQYRLLESKLFSLYEYEKESNPARSILLQKAFQQSQESGTASELQRIVRLLEDLDFKDAESRQAAVLAKLNALLELLQSEDRGKRIRNDILRHQEYLKEIEHLQRLERGLRGQAENASNQADLAQEQEQTANKTKELSNTIRRSEGQSKEDQQSADPQSSDAELQPTGKSPQPSNKSVPENQPVAPSSDPSPDRNANPRMPADGAHEPTPPTPDGGQEPNPIQQPLEAAEQRMRNAAERLKAAEHDSSLDEMRAAERELAEAKRALEEILRQLREEEIGRALASLESRFRQMLEREIKVHDQTQVLEKTPVPDRGADFPIAVGKLALEQKAIAVEAARAQLLLDEDGTSFALPQTVEQMHADMVQVAERLESNNINPLTVELQTEIIETLKYLVDSLVKAQNDLADKQAPQADGQGQPVDRALVDKLSEIKMIRNLQERINRRHLRYGEMLANPNDPIGRTERTDLRDALEKIAARQRELVEITRNVWSKSK